MDRAPLRPPRRRSDGSHRAALPALGVVALLAAASAAAQPATGVAQQQGQIERLQQERLRQEQERALQAPPPQPGADLRTLTPPLAVPDLGAGCHPIRELRIEGAVHLDPQVRADAVRDATGRCVGAAELEALLGALTRAYIERGFVTTRIYLPPQDLRGGVLRLTVVEGTIERFELAQTGHDRESIRLQGAFPSGPGALLNLRELEQGLEQINSLQSNRATLDLQPGAQPGQSVVVVRNRARAPVHLYLSYDNLGTPATGRHNVAATLSLDSLLGWNELVAVTRSQTVVRESGHQADSTALRGVLPLGWWTLGVDASHSDYRNALSLPSGLPLLASGHSTSYGLTAARVVMRDQSRRVSVSGRLGLHDSENLVGGQLLAVNSRRLSTLDLGVAGYSPLAGGVANGRLGYVRGLRAFGALHDQPGVPADYPRAQFGKFTLDFGYQRRFQLAGQPLQWSSLFSAQRSRHPLFGSQQFLVGSPSTVRGSRLNALSGDHGALWRNDVALPWVLRAGGAAVAGSLYVGHDIGRTRNRAGGLQGSMSSVTLGATAQWRGMSIEAFASRALTLPGFMAGEGTLYGLRVTQSL